MKSGLGAGGAPIGVHPVQPIFIGAVHKSQDLGHHGVKFRRDLLAHVQLGQYFHQIRVLLDGDVVLSGQGQDFFRRRCPRPWPRPWAPGPFPACSLWPPLFSALSRPGPWVLPCLFSESDGPGRAGCARRGVLPAVSRDWPAFVKSVDPQGRLVFACARLQSRRPRPGPVGGHASCDWQNASGWAYPIYKRGRKAASQSRGARENRPLRGGQPW